MLDWHKSRGSPNFVEANPAVSCVIAPWLLTLCLVVWLHTMPRRPPGGIISLRGVHTAQCALPAMSCSVLHGFLAEWHSTSGLPDRRSHFSWPAPACAAQRGSARAPPPVTWAEVHARCCSSVWTVRSLSVDCCSRAHVDRAPTLPLESTACRLVPPPPQLGPRTQQGTSWARQPSRSAQTHLAQAAGAAGNRAVSMR